MGDDEDDFSDIDLSDDEETSGTPVAPKEVTNLINLRHQNTKAGDDAGALQLTMTAILTKPLLLKNYIDAHNLGEGIQRLLRGMADLPILSKVLVNIQHIPFMGRDGSPVKYDPKNWPAKIQQYFTNSNHVKDGGNYISFAATLASDSLSANLILKGFGLYDVGSRSFNSLDFDNQIYYYSPRHSAMLNITPELTQLYMELFAIGL